MVKGHGGMVTMVQPKLTYIIILKQKIVHKILCHSFATKLKYDRL